MNYLRGSIAQAGTAVAPRSGSRQRENRNGISSKAGLPDSQNPYANSRGFHAFFSMAIMPEGSQTSLPDETVLSQPGRKADAL
jgi:hypothetical protein